MKRIIFFTMLLFFLSTTGYVAYSSNIPVIISPVEPAKVIRGEVEKTIILTTKAPITKEDLKNINYPTTICFADEPILISTNCNAPDGSCIYTYSITIRCYTFNLN